MNKNKKVGLVIIGIIILAGTFYGGIVYGKSQVPVRGAQAFGQNGPGGARGLRNGAGPGGFTAGQIIAKDDKSITVELMAAGAAPGQTGSGSKIIFLDSNTKISKSVSGTAADLAIGTGVTVNGTPNSDGSINATAVQIRPQNVVR